MFTLLVCACAGIISEIITITIPEKIIDIVQKDPEELLHQRFYKFLLFLSGLYIGFVILLFFSGIDRFRYYGIIILVLSVSGWLLRAKLEKYTFLIIANSTVCLILLLDVVRGIILSLR
jgi:hypothetical protein